MHSSNTSFSASSKYCGLNHHVPSLGSATTVLLQVCQSAAPQVVGWLPLHRALVLIPVAAVHQQCRPGGCGSPTSALLSGGCTHEATAAASLLCMHLHALPPHHMQSFGIFCLGPHAHAQRAPFCIVCTCSWLEPAPSSEGVVHPLIELTSLMEIRSDQAKLPADPHCHLPVHRRLHRLCGPRVPGGRAGREEARGEGDHH